MVFVLHLVLLQLSHSISFWSIGLLFRYKNQTVAVKIVHNGETPEEIAKREARFAREVAMLSRVQHKNLVKVVGFSFKDPNIKNRFQAS